MASESTSASTATGVGLTSAPTIREIISTNQNLQILKDFNLCIMTDNSQKAQCKHCFHFLSQGSNTTLRNHITHPHCEAIKAQQNQNPKAGQTSMARDESVFRYDPDYLREQFAGLVIQRALPFNHFDHEQTKRVFHNTMQPRYTHRDMSDMAIRILSQIFIPQAFATFDVLDFEEDVFDDEVQRNEVIPLSDEEIALDASSEDTLSLGGPQYDYMMSSETEDE
ncbi:hypothetical protein Tco_0525471 [Tanacetum coccineum]